MTLAEPRVPSLVMDQPTYSTPFPRSARRERAPARVRRGARALRASPSRSLPLFLAAALRSSAAGRSSASSRTTPTRATSPRLRAGSSVRRASASSPPAASAGRAASSRRLTWSASVPARSKSSRPEGSSAPRLSARPRACRRRDPAGDHPARGRGRAGSEELAERLALAGYERVDQAQERGQFAVRGGIVDVFPSTGREPDPDRALRRRDRVAPRLLRLHPAHAAPARRSGHLSGRRAPLRPRRALGRGRAGRPAGRPRRRRFRPPTSSGRRTRCAGRRRRSSASEPASAGRSSLDQLPAGQRYAFEAQRPAVAARGLAEAERDLLAFVRGGNRVVVTFAHRGEALRTKALLRRIEPELLEPGDDLRTRRGALLRRCARPARIRPARARARPAPGHAGLPQAPTARRRPHRAGTAELRRPPHRRLRRPRGPRRRQAARLRDEDGRRRHARLPLPRASRATTGSTSRTSRSARSRATSAPTGTRRRSRSSAARPGRRSRPAPAAGARELAGELIALYAQRQRRRGRRLRGRRRPGRAARGELPYEETPDQQRAIEAVKEDLETPRPMDRLVCGDVGFGKTEVAVRAAFAVGRQRQADARARADDDPRAAALEHLPRALPRSARHASRWSRGSASRRT